MVTTSHPADVDRTPRPVHIMLTMPADDPRAVALTSAIHDGDVERLERQLRDEPQLASARIEDRHGVSRTPLHIVADWPGHCSNGARSVAALIAAGADVDARVLHTTTNVSPETALHWAASSDDVTVLDALLDGGAEIEASGAVFTGGPPMSDAVVFAQWRAARRLLERGASTTIWQAAAAGLLDRVRELCTAEPAPDLNQITNALWHASRGGQREVAEYLIDLGADVNWIGHDSKTPCDAAKTFGDAELVEWLRERGARHATELR